MKSFWIASLFLVLLTTGCARISSDKSKVTLDFSGFYQKSQSILSQNGEEDNGFPTLVTISRRDGTRAQHFKVLPGMSLDLELERGEVTIQALLFGPDETLVQPAGNERDGGMRPYLVVQEVTLDQPEQTLSLTAVPITDFMGGDVGGRILTTSNNGPTGVVTYNIKVNAQLPPLKLDIFKPSIVNGWFQFFALHSSQLLGIEYLLPDGTNAFGPGEVHNLSTLYQNSNKQTQVVLPNRATIRSDTTGYRFDGARGAESYILGFWGPGVGPDQKAYQSFVDPITESYKYQSNLVSMDSAMLSSFLPSLSLSYFSWSSETVSQVFSQAMSVTETSPSSGIFQGITSVRHRGGLNISLPPDPTMSESLLFSSLAISSGTKDHFTGFRGIFRVSEWSNGDLKFVASNTDHKLYLLPDVQLGKVEVFINTTSKDDELDEESDTCEGLRNGSHPAFVKYAETGVATLTGTLSTGGSGTDQYLQISTIPAELYQMAICAQVTSPNYSIPLPMVFYAYELSRLRPGEFVPVIADACDTYMTEGSICTDGSYVIGNRTDSTTMIDDYKYILHPGLWSATWGYSATTTNANSTEGPANQVSLDASNGSLFASGACKDLGSDWFLPSEAEWVHFHSELVGPNAATYGINTSGQYWTSNETNSDQAKVRDMEFGTITDVNKDSSKDIRCMRRVPL